MLLGFAGLLLVSVLGYGVYRYHLLTEELTRMNAEFLELIIPGRATESQTATLDQGDRATELWFLRE